MNSYYKKALIVWDGHSPKAISEILAAHLRQNDFEVTLSDTLDAYRDLNLTDFHLIVPNWTMGTIKPEQLKLVLAAVKSGVELAGLHGGMCDGFRNECDWPYMTGGQWVAHPGNDAAHYSVLIDGEKSPIMEGISTFDVTTEQYYMHVDPANTVLATTRFGATVMPLVDENVGQRPRVLQQPRSSSRCGGDDPDSHDDDARDDLGGAVNFLLLRFLLLNLNLCSDKGLSPLFLGS